MRVAITDISMRAPDSSGGRSYAFHRNGSDENVCWGQSSVVVGDQLIEHKLIKLTLRLNTTILCTLWDFIKNITFA